MQIIKPISIVAALAIGVAACGGNQLKADAVATYAQIVETVVKEMGLQAS